MKKICLMLLPVILSTKLEYVICEKSYAFIDELFGSGLSQDQIKSESKRYISSSTEDLKLLLDQEVKLVDKLRPYTKDSVVNAYFKELGNIQDILR